MATPQTHTPAPPADDEDDIVDPGAGRQTPPPSANGQPKKPASKHDPLVVDMARQYGLTDDEMEAIHPTLLKERVMGAFRRDHQVARELGGRQAGSPAAGGGGAASSPPPPPPAPEPEVDWGEVEIEDAAGAKVKRKMTDEDFAPGLVRIIKEQQKAIRSLQGEIQSDRQQRSWSQIYSMYDKALEGLGAWGKEMFGEGPGHEIDPTGAEMKRRTTLFGQLGLDFSKAVRQKDMNEAVSRMAPVLFKRAPTNDPDAAAHPYDAARNGSANGTPKKPAAPARPTEEDWDQGGLNLPTGRTNEAHERGIEAAKAAAAEGLRKLGLQTDSQARSREDQDALDSLPD